MKPAVCYYWLSKMCAAVRATLDVVPPVFDNCQALISREDETTARDAYWDVVMHEKTMTIAQQEERLATVIRLNPFIAEPHLLRAQLAFRAGDYRRSQIEARASTEKFFVMGTAWDKRIRFQTWVAQARMLLLRSNRKAAGLSSSLPLALNQPPTSGGLPIVMLDDLMDAFDSRTQPAQ